jgi:hypothetical protein
MQEVLQPKRGDDEHICVGHVSLRATKLPQSARVEVLRGPSFDSHAKALSSLGVLVSPVVRLAPHGTLEHRTWLSVPFVPARGGKLVWAYCSSGELEDWKLVDPTAPTGQQDIDHDQCVASIELMSFSLWALLCCGIDAWFTVEVGVFCPIATSMSTPFELKFVWSCLSLFTRAPSSQFVHIICNTLQ